MAKKLAYPLDRPAALGVLDNAGEYEAVAGQFLVFVMIGIEERIGEWRYAGKAESLGDAFRRVEEFAEKLGLPDPDEFFRGLIESTAVEFWTGDRAAPLAGIGPHRVVLCGEGQAPYDDHGFCIVDVPSLARCPYARRRPQTRRPAEWDQTEGE